MALGWYGVGLIYVLDDTLLLTLGWTGSWVVFFTFILLNIPFFWLSIVELKLLNASTSLCIDYTLVFGFGGYGCEKFPDKKSKSNEFNAMGTTVGVL